MKRRAFIKGILISGIASSLLARVPAAFAEWRKEAFAAKTFEAAMLLKC